MIEKNVVVRIEFKGIEPRRDSSSVGRVVGLYDALGESCLTLGIRRGKTTAGLYAPQKPVVLRA